MIGRWLRGVRMGFWLGWLTESNWTDPLLFAIYTVVRPLTGVLLLYFMFAVLSGGQRGPMLDFFLVGSILWPYVSNSMQGIAYTVVEDREAFHMLRYVYLTPIPYSIYLVGRAMAKVALATIAVAITFFFAVAVLGLPLQPANMNIPYLLVSLLIGFVGMWAVGMMVAALSMNLTQGAWSMPDAMGGALYLLCGAIFPLSQLPPFLQALGSLLPMTYWLEAARRGFLGAGTITSFAGLSDVAVLARLALTTALACLAGAYVFAAGERLAKSTGNLDRVSEY
jgi:ABC-2 type transport system permease protein